MTDTPWLSVVGLGEDGLDVLPPAVRLLVDEAEHVIGGERHLAMLPETHSAKRMTWRSPLRDTIADIRALEGRKVCVLATGDPMSYGMGVTLGREFGHDALTVIPAPGAFTLAAARLGWPLERCACLGLHAAPFSRLAPHLAPGMRILCTLRDGAAAGRERTAVGRDGAQGAVVEQDAAAGALEVREVGGGGGDASLDPVEEDEEERGRQFGAVGAASGRGGEGREFEPIRSAVGAGRAGQAGGEPDRGREVR